MMCFSTLNHKANLNLIQHASVWEDADILCEALAPSSCNGRILSVASSGDNVLALLTIDPTEIIAAGLSAAQLACFELRIAAFRCLDHPDLLAFLGVTPSSDRWQTYTILQKELSSSASQFWNSRQNAIKLGIIHAGKVERYLRFFGTKILPWIHSKDKRETLLDSRTLNEQTLFYNEQWDTRLWKTAFNFFFSKTFIKLFNRNASHFDIFEETISEKILARTRHAMTQLPTFSNPYLIYILTGNYDAQALPRYLRPEYKDVITSRTNRIKLFQKSIQEVDSGPFDGYNLSTVFENMNDSDFESCYQNLVAKANPGARLAYWNKLVNRTIPPSLKNHVAYLDDISSAFHFHDKAWFYQSFHVDEVLASPFLEDRTESR
jgi:S-adenosylmethionine-diacylglycerol 3-amino-3-carboxypropyl transferase